MCCSCITWNPFPKALHQRGYISPLRKSVIHCLMCSPRGPWARGSRYQVETRSGWHGALRFPPVGQSIGLKRICLCKESAISKEPYFIIYANTDNYLKYQLAGSQIFLFSLKGKKPPNLHTVHRSMETKTPFGQVLLGYVSPE